MTFTYSGNPSTSTRDAIRLYSQDVDFDDPLISDEEIDFLIDAWSHVTEEPVYLAAVVCDVIASKFARELSYSADGISVQAAELQTKYATLATNLREQFKDIEIGGGPDVGGIMYGEEIDPSIQPLVWAKGMHDNWLAGQQDFGGTQPNADFYPERDGTYPT